MDLNSWIPLLIALATGIGVELVRQYFIKHKTEADTGQILITSSGQVILQWRELVQVLQQTVKEKDAEKADLEKQVAEQALRLERYGRALYLLMAASSPELQLKVTNILAGSEDPLPGPFPTYPKPKGGETKNGSSTL